MSHHYPEVDIVVVGYQNHGIAALEFVPRQLHAIDALVEWLRSDMRVVEKHLRAQPPQALDDQGGRCLAGILRVPLAGRAEHRHPRSLHRFAAFVQAQQHPLDDMGWHMVIDFIGYGDKARQHTELALDLPR